MPTLPADIEAPQGHEQLSVQERLEFLDRAGLITWPKRGTMPRFKRYLDESKGVGLQDIIWDIPPIASGAHERMGYTTQKPLALLERIIKASSNPGDHVLDPFAGCATTLEAAHKLGRRWTGIDIAIHAVKRVARIRLKTRLGLEAGKDYEIEGMPRNLEGAEDLWRRDPYQFQQWAVESVDGFVTNRRSGDGGVDGRIYFGKPDGRPLENMLIEVKGGKHVNIGTVRAVRGALEKDDAFMAGLVMMYQPRKRQEGNFKSEMSKASVVEIDGVPYPRMQMLTVEQILEGWRFNTPPVAGLQERQPRLAGIHKYGE